MVQMWAMSPPLNFIISLRNGFLIELFLALKIESDSLQSEVLRSVKSTEAKNNETEQKSLQVFE